MTEQMACSLPAGRKCLADCSIISQKDLQYSLSVCLSVASKSGDGAGKEIVHNKATQVVAAHVCEDTDDGGTHMHWFCRVVREFLPHR